jgi:hypothetical protein
VRESLRSGLDTERLAEEPGFETTLSRGDA